MSGSGRIVRWILIVGLGEVVGFAVPATVGVLLVDSPWAFAALLAAGSIEGALLGFAQHVAMRRDFPSLRRAPWVLLTAGAAAVAYACGLLPSTLSAWWTTWPLGLQLAAGAALAIVLLASIGSAQWLELRRHLRRAGWWIAGTALAWMLGLGAFFAIAPPLWHEGQPVAQVMAIGIAAGVIMAVVMAAVTGTTFALLLRAAPVGAPHAVGVTASGA